MMTATAKRPDLGEFLALTFSPEAASALTRTNALAKQLRDMPANLLTPELVDDRERVLGEHLTDLLAAHRDARKAGAVDADADLVDGLDHVREEVARIIMACQSRANDTLATQSRFLEARYPAAADDPLSTAMPEPDMPAIGEGEGPRKLTADALDALLPRRTPVRTPAPAAPAPEKKPRRDADWYVTRGMSALLCVTFIWGVSHIASKNSEMDSLARAFPKQIAVATTIDSVRRDVTDWQGTQVPVVAVTFHGTVTNNAKEDAKRILLAIDVSACPESGPASACKLLQTAQYYPTNDTQFLAGLTTRFRHTERIEVPDVDGTLKARVRLVGVSPFAN